MKKSWMSVVLIGIGLAWTPARAEMIYQGTYEVGLAGIIDFDTADDALIEIDLTLGQFVADYWEIGFLAGFANSDSLTRFRGGLFTEYNFEINRTVLPFVGVNLNLVAIDADFEDSPLTGEDAALGVGGIFGVKGFLHENVALTAAFTFDWATDDIYLDGTTAEDTDLQLKLGLRYYF